MKVNFLKHPFFSFFLATVLEPCIRNLVIFFLKFWWSNILAISLQISKNTLQFFLQFLISNFSFFLFFFFFYFFFLFFSFFFFKNLPRLRVHPQLSHIGYPVDGVLVDAGSLWPKRVRETHSTCAHLDFWWVKN